jgi:hypothetical protein
MEGAGALESFPGLDAKSLARIEAVASAQGLNPYGLCGELAQQGLEAYVPARDGFTLVLFVNAVANAKLPAVEAAELTSYLSRAIYAIDAFCLGGVCNCGIFNANGLQIDDGSATEVGMMGMRGMPIVIYRDQATSQLGPGLQNPMPIGNASSTLSPTGYSTVQTAVKALKDKIEGIVASRPTWTGSSTYACNVPPPPLYIYWQSVGEAVFRVKFRTKTMIVDKNGRLDALASYTPFYYANSVKDPSVSNLVRVARRIMEVIKEVENRFAPLINLYPEAALPYTGGGSYGV